MRSLQTKGNLILAIGGHFLEVAVPGLARIKAKLLGRPARQQVPPAFDVVGGKRFAVVTSDATMQRQGKLGPLLVPRPAGRQVRNDRCHAVLRHILPNMTRLLKTPIIGRLTAPIASSCIDIEAALSKCDVIRTPPDFCASATGPARVSDNADAAANSRFRLIVHTFPDRRTLLVVRLVRRSSLVAGAIAGYTIAGLETIPAAVPRLRSYAFAAGANSRLAWKNRAPISVSRSTANSSKTRFEASAPSGQYGSSYEKPRGQLY